MSLLVGGNLADRCGEVQTGADKSVSWVSFSVGRHLAEICGQLRTAMDKSGSWVSSVAGHLVDRWRTGEDRCGQVRKSHVSGCHLVG